MLKAFRNLTSFGGRKFSTKVEGNTEVKTESKLYKFGSFLSESDGDTS